MAGLFCLLLGVKACVGNSRDRALGLGLGLVSQPLSLDLSLAATLVK
jgi:hypothetical protein